MVSRVRSWFRRNVYGKFLLRVFVALGAAAISVALSYLPYDTALQSIWVVVSSLFMGFLVLRQRLNESDDDRYCRLFNSRFTYLEQHDPEALTTIFAENIRPRVLNWFDSEYGVAVSKASRVDALDSLARSGDMPGQLIFRTGVELGQWLQDCNEFEDKLPQLEARLDEFVLKNESLLGEEVAAGIFFRHLHNGERRPVGIHMFHPRSRLLLTVEYYDAEKKRHAISLSARSSLFDTGGESAWTKFQEVVHSDFPCFQPANGGSGPQRLGIPFFVSSIADASVESDEVLKTKLLHVAEMLPEVEVAKESDPSPRDSSDEETDTSG